MGQSVIGDRCVPKVQRFEVGHLPEQAEPLVSNSRVTKVQSLQVGQGLQECKFFVRNTFTPEVDQSDRLARLLVGEFNLSAEFFDGSNGLLPILGGRIRYRRRRERECQCN